MAANSQTIVILVIVLLCLITLLIFLYKKLNKEANGEYTIRNIVYKEGGVRDQLRGVALALGTRLGVQLWPREDMEMEEVRDEEAQVLKGNSQVSESEDQDSKAQEEESDSSDDESSVGGSEAGEEARLTGEPETGEEGKEKEGKMEGEGNGGAELLKNLKELSGSAIWSEDQAREFSEVTPL